MKTYLVALSVVAATLLGCGSVEPLPLVVSDAGVDLVAPNLDAPPSDRTSTENPASDGGVLEDGSYPDADGADLVDPIPSCAARAMLPLAGECRPGCYRCLGANFALLATSQRPCAPSCAASGECPPATVCAYACGDCP